MARPTEILFVRHAETTWNRERRLQGHGDSPLTARGVREAERVAAFLARTPWHALYSSDLGRTVRTADVLARRVGLPVVTDERLRERNAGPLEGLTASEAEARHPDAYAWLKTGITAEARFGVESLHAQYGRTVACVEEIARRHEGESVLAVAHGGTLGCVIRRALGLPLTAPRRWSLANCSLNRFRVEGDAWHLVHWGLSPAEHPA